MSKSFSFFSLCPLLIVIVSLSGCPTGELIQVPDLYGMQAEQAEQATVDAGLVTGDLYGDYSDEQPAGYVLEQDPAAGDLVDPGTAVALLISLGPDTGSEGEGEGEGDVGDHAEALSHHVPQGIDF